MATPFSATRWVLFGSFGSRALAFFGQAIILRLVSKEVFGAYGAIMAFPLMLMPLIPMGFDQLLIREKHIARHYAMAVAWSLAMWGVALTATTLLIAVALGWELIPPLGEAIDGRALAVLSLIFVIFATKQSIRSMLAARLEFRTISIAEFGNGMITYFGGALAVAFSPTLVALLVAYLAGELFECYWLYRGRRFRPLAMLRPARMWIFWHLFRKHRKFCLANTADLTMNNMGSLLPAPLIVLWISEEANADFSAARMLIQLPIMLLAGAIWRVAYPTISGVTEQVLQERCLRIIGTTAAVLAPGVIWLGFFAPSLAFMLGGERYLTAAPLIQWMAVYMILVSVFNPISSLDMIRDKPEIGLYWNIVLTGARVGAIWYFAPMGLVHAIAAMSVASAVVWIGWAATLGWLLRCGPGAYIHAVGRFIPGWLLLAGAFWLCTLQEGLVVPMLLSIPAGLIYLAVVMRFFPKEASMVYRIAGMNR